MLNYEKQLGQTTNLKSDFEPYVDNGGTAAALVGTDFAVIAADTRISAGTGIISRNTSKISQLTDSCFILSTGMLTDAIALHKDLKIQIEIYKMHHRRQPSTETLANLLGITLYGRRHFPYYTFNLLVGQKKDGTFTVFGYDAVGSHESTNYGSSGSGSHITIPVLDLLKDDLLTKEEAKKKVLNTMYGTSNRDTATGDKLEMIVINKDLTIERSLEKLRED